MLCDFLHNRIIFGGGAQRGGQNSMSGMQSIRFGASQRQKAVERPGTNRLRWRDHTPSTMVRAASGGMS